MNKFFNKFIHFIFEEFQLMIKSFTQRLLILAVMLSLFLIITLLLKVIRDYLVSNISFFEKILKDIEILEISLVASFIALGIFNLLKAKYPILDITYHKKKKKML
jgi:hypothetical protein